MTCVRRRGRRLDPYSGSSSGAQGPVYEMAAIMYNIGALHTILGAADSRQTPDGMKMSCTHFQCAAGAFQVAGRGFVLFLCSLKKAGWR